MLLSHSAQFVVGHGDGIFDFNSDDTPGWLLSRRPFSLTTGTTATHSLVVILVVIAIGIAILLLFMVIAAVTVFFVVGVIVTLHNILVTNYVAPVQSPSLWRWLFSVIVIIIVGVFWIAIVIVIAIATNGRHLLVVLVLAVIRFVVKTIVACGLGWFI